MKLVHNQYTLISWFLFIIGIVFFLLGIIGFQLNGADSSIYWPWLAQIPNYFTTTIITNEIVAKASYHLTDLELTASFIIFAVFLLILVIYFGIKAKKNVSVR